MKLLLLCSCSAHVRLIELATQCSSSSLLNPLAVSQLPHTKQLVLTPPILVTFAFFRPQTICQVFRIQLVSLRISPPAESRLLFRRQLSPRSSVSSCCCKSSTSRSRSLPINATKVIMNQFRRSRSIAKRSHVPLFRHRKVPTNHKSRRF